MATLKPRSQIIHPTEGVSLRAQFYDLSGNPVDLPTAPQITIIQPSGNVVIGPTSMGVYRVNTGLYGFDYTTALQVSQGVWVDLWRGQIPSGEIVVKEFNFNVFYTQTPLTNSDGYWALGDDVPFNYSQTAILNINKLLKGLKARLKSSGKSAGVDQFNNPIYVDCDIYSTDQLVTFLAQSLSMFNQIPHFTMFEFHHTEIITIFYDILVQGATLLALSSQALIERGREYSLSDNGVSLTPPTISELLNTQWSTELTNYMDKCKMAKATMKPAPQAIGSLTGSVMRAPQFARLRWLRARQIY
jgi:hypothetical protein